MIWLLAKIWGSLAIAALLGLIIGWLSRGIGLKKRVLRAQMELAEMAKDRDEQRAQSEALQAQLARREDAPRPVAAVTAVNGNGQALQAELAQRDLRLKLLTDELARSKAELERLQLAGQRQDNAAKPAAPMDAVLPTGQVAAAPAAPAADGRTPDLAAELAALQKSREELVWRNRYLETRVGVLERAAEKASIAATPATQVEPGSEKETFMREREGLMAEVKSLKERLAQSQASITSAAPSPQRTAETDQELARLRWRNRYLESRLDYLEGRRESETGAATPAAGTSASPAPTEQQDSPPVTDRVMQPGPTVVTDLASGEMADTATPVARVHFLPEEPVRLTAPEDPGPDALTAITGIGPLIEGALNRLGIFHYAQLASWTPAQAMWVSDAIGFPGRVEQEGWGQQARALLLTRAISGTEPGT